MKTRYPIITLLLLVSFCTQTLRAQHKCATMDRINDQISQDPSRALRLAGMEETIARWCEHHHGESRGAVLTIPVVVHVLWNSEEQNISDEQVISQIDGLTEDFRLQNFDAPDENHPFWYESQDTYIEFCLAQQDPDGFETDGINRVWTPVEFWTEDQTDEMKFSEYGGVDNWDPTSYLNIWVIEPSPDMGLLGWATFPDELETSPELDGVVIRNNAFGFLGTVESPNDLGRTGTHEVGHWLSLRHIWGDETCGDDFVDDTPPAFEANYGCPEFPLNPNSKCGTDEYGEMFMNYMDYVDDACMNMFTTGQAVRMDGAIENYRFGLYDSYGCEPGSAVMIDEVSGGSHFSLYPNPTAGIIHLRTGQDGYYTLSLFDAGGRLVRRELFPVRGEVATVSLEDLAPGVYSGIIYHGDSQAGEHHRIVIH